MYNECLDDETMFYFNVDFDEDKNPIIGNGEENNHTNIMFTSKKLMSLLKNLEYFTLMEHTKS